VEVSRFGYGIAALGLVCSIAPGARAGIIYVDQNNTAVTHDGASWATSFLKVQDALTAALRGDEVWVAGGVYTETITLADRVSAYGGFAGTETARVQRDPRANQTILNGAGNATLVTCTVQGALMDGFTLRKGGFALFVTNRGSATLVNNIVSDNGGGLFVDTGTLTVSRCTILRNGYGVYLSPGSAALLLNNTIAANGGGVFLDYLAGSPREAASATLINNTICGNSYGVASPLNNLVTLYNNIIAFNSSYGVSTSSADSLTAANNNVFGNAVGNYRFSDRTGMSGNISEDPRLSSLYQDVHIQPDSPCRNAGDNEWAVGVTDIDGQPRLQEGVVDMGADESDGTLHAPVSRTWFVSATGLDTNDGTSWGQAKRTVASALLQAGGDDEVWVANGTYAERISIPAGVSLFGGFVGTETAREQRNRVANPTILDGGGSGFVVSCPLQGAVVDGFTVRNGVDGVHCVNGTIALMDCIVSGNGANGVFVQSGGARVGGSTFTGNGRGINLNNAAGTVTGSGISGSANYGVFLQFGSVTLDANAVFSNVNGFGLSQGSATLTNNIFQQNSQNGVELTAGAATLTYNRSSNNGNGVLIGTATATCIRNFLQDNSAAGLFVTGAGKATLISNRITNNIGAGVQINPGGQGTLYNNTLASSSNYGVFINGGSATMFNNVIAFNNFFGVRMDGAGALTMSKNDVFGQTTNYLGVSSKEQQRNISANPLFVDAARKNYRLTANSPCRDTGDDAAVTPGDLDLDLHARRIGSHVDMGAFEFLPDGFVTMPDVLDSLRIAGGISTASVAGLARLNVVDAATPLIDLSDAVRLARKVAGLDSNP
jgi:parallel beta-helix repeat protein